LPVDQGEGENHVTVLPDPAVETKLVLIGPTLVTPLLEIDHVNPWK
jgi:hypothetical protein